MSDWTDVKDWATTAASGAYDYGIGQRVLALVDENERLAAILARQKSRRADDDECLSLATQSIDELRKDAERHRWLKVQKIHVCKDFNDSGLPTLGVMFSIRGYEWIGLSENIDAAMGKGDHSEIHHTSWALVHEPPPTCVKCGVKMFTGIAPQTLCNRRKHD